MATFPSLKPTYIPLCNKPTYIPLCNKTGQSPQCFKSLHSFIKGFIQCILLINFVCGQEVNLTGTTCWLDPFLCMLHKTVAPFHGHTLHITFGPHQAKECLRACKKCADSHHSAHAQSVMQTFALHSYFL